MTRFRPNVALVGLVLLLPVLVACGGAGPGAGGTPPSGPKHTSLEGQIVVPSDFLEDVELSQLMASGRVWLVDASGEFLLSAAPDSLGAFELEEVPAGVSGQRLMAIFGTGDDAVTLETMLGPLPASSTDVPFVAVNISLASTVQAEVLRHPEMAEQLRMDVLNSLPGMARTQLRSFALEPLDLADGADMLTIVGDTSSLANDRATTTGYSQQADDCAWWNPLSWAGCWETPDLQVQNGGRTANIVRRPPVPQNYAMGIEYQSNVSARIIAAGGGNIIATGGGNIIATGGGNIIATGGGNIIATGGGNIIATGGGNIIATGGLNNNGLATLSNGVEVVRRVDFGDVLAEGEIGELRRFGPQILSDFVIVPASLFDEYTDAEVAFIAKNISWAGERGREAAERIIADMRARESAATEIRSSYRRAAESPAITLPAEAKQHSAPQLVYVNTSAGKAALSAPVIVSAKIPADDSSVVEISARNVEPGMQAYWRSGDGSFDAEVLTEVGEETYRAALSVNGYTNLMIAASGPASPHSNLVSVLVESGGVITPAVNVQGFGGIGGQGGSADFFFEDASGDLFTMDVQKTILNLPSGGSEWTPLSQGLVESLQSSDRNLLAVGASQAGELYVLLEGQVYRLGSNGVWEAHGPELRDPADNVLVCRYGAGGLVDRDGGIYQLDMCNTTLYLSYLDPAGTEWTQLLSDDAIADGPLQLAGDGNLYFVGRESGWTSGVLQYKLGSSSFSLVFSPTLTGAQAERLTVDDAGNLLLLADPTDSGDPDSFRLYHWSSEEIGWQSITSGVPFDGFDVTEVARPRGDGPIYAISYPDAYTNSSLYRLDVDSTEWLEEDEPGFERTFGTFSHKDVQGVWPGQNGSLFVRAAGMLFRKASTTSSWEGLSHGLSSEVGIYQFAYTDDEVLVKNGAPAYSLPSGNDTWQKALLDSGTYPAGLLFDRHRGRAYGWSMYPTSLHRRGVNDWQEIDSSPQFGGIMDAAFAPDGTMFVLVMVESEQRVQMFDGANWTNVGDPVTAATMLTVAEDGDIYVGGYEGVHLLPAGEEQWQEVGSLSMGGSQGYQLAIAPDGALYGSWSQYGVSRFASGASSWVTVNTGLPSHNGTAHGAHDLVIDSSGAVFAATDHGVYRLPPNGTEWEAVTGLLGVIIKALAIGPDNRLYAHAGESGVFRSLP